MTHNVTFALLLALFAGLSTGIGSIINYFIHQPKPQHMPLILGFSGGVMIYIAFVAKDVPISTIFRGVMPFGLADIVGVILLVLISLQALFLPNLMK